jgi:hypothetical protein
MSEIDPWEMPQTAAANPGSVGLPGSAYAPAPRLLPLGRRLPRLAGAFGVLYVLVSITEIFYIDHAATLAYQLNALILSDQFPTVAQSAQLQGDDNAIGMVSWIAVIAFLGTLALIGVWQRALGEAFGSVGARRAVFDRAGYPYFRAAWLLCLVLALFLQATTTSGNVNSYSDVVGHDHLYMILFGAQALGGAFVVYFAGRLRRVSEEGVALLNGTYVPD